MLPETIWWCFQTGHDNSTTALLNPLQGCFVAASTEEYAKAHNFWACTHTAIKVQNSSLRSLVIAHATNRTNRIPTKVLKTMPTSLCPVQPKLLYTLNPVASVRHSASFNICNICICTKRYWTVPFINKHHQGHIFWSAWNTCYNLIDIFII